MRKNFLPLLVASLFLFSCSINSEERSYKGKPAVVLVNATNGVQYIIGKLKSISRDEIILEEVAVSELFLLNERYLEIARFIKTNNPNLKATVIIKKEYVVAIAIVPPPPDDKTPFPSKNSITPPTSDNKKDDNKEDEQEEQ